MRAGQCHSTTAGIERSRLRSIFLAATSSLMLLRLRETRWRLCSSRCQRVMVFHCHVSTVATHGLHTWIGTPPQLQTRWWWWNRRGTVSMSNFLRIRAQTDSATARNDWLCFCADVVGHCAVINDFCGFLVHVLFVWSSKYGGRRRWLC